MKKLLQFILLSTFLLLNTLEIKAQSSDFCWKSLEIFPIHATCNGSNDSGIQINFFPQDVYSPVKIVITGGLFGGEVYNQTWFSTGAKIGLPMPAGTYSVNIYSGWVDDLTYKCKTEKVVTVKEPPCDLEFHSVKLNTDSRSPKFLYLESKVSGSFCGFNYETQMEIILKGKKYTYATPFRPGQVAKDTVVGNSIYYFNPLPGDTIQVTMDNSNESERNKNTSTCKVYSEKIVYPCDIKIDSLRAFKNACGKINISGRLQTQYLGFFTNVQIITYAKDFFKFGIYDKSGKLIYTHLIQNRGGGFGENTGAFSIDSDTKFFTEEEYVIKWKLGDNCQYEAPFSFQKAEVFVVAPTITGKENCGSGVVSLTAAGGTTGSSYRWYTVPTGGTPIFTTTAATFTTPTLTANTTYYVALYNTSICEESNRTPVTVTINPLPDAPVVTANVGLCQGANATTLSANGSNLKWYTVATGGTALTSPPTPATTTLGTTDYYVSQTVNGCEGSRAKISITITAPATVTQAPFQNPICNSVTNYVLTGGQPAGGTYSGTGVSNGIFNAAIAGGGLHTITYTYSNNGCLQTATQDITVNTCTGIKEASELAKSLLVYPNPTNNMLNVSLPLPGKTLVTVRLLDMKGKKILEQIYKSKISELKAAYNLSGEAKGLYLLQIITEKEVLNKQVALQ